jgi:hypothetical protein
LLAFLATLSTLPPETKVLAESKLSGGFYWQKVESSKMERLLTCDAPKTY